MKKSFTTKMIAGIAKVFASLTTASAQSYPNNSNDQSAYQDQQYTQTQTQPQQFAQPNQYQAAPDVQQQGYYYYPDANVYYDPSCNHYIYNDGYGWLTVNVLPFNIRIGNLPRFMVYHR